MTIKVGSVCYVVNTGHAYVGRVVTVIGRGVLAEWEVDAQWIREWAFSCGYRRVDMSARHLRPIDDPDEPVTTHTPEALTA